MIGIISDVHSNMEALETVLDYFKKHKVKKIVCAGDFIGYGPNPNEAIELLVKNKVMLVKGNHEYGYLTSDLRLFNQPAREAIAWQMKRITPKNRRIISKLREKSELKIGKVKIIIIHATPHSLFEYVYPQTPDRVFENFLNMAKADVLIMGHTHIPCVKKIGKRMIINPGSVGQPRDYDSRASFALYDSVKKTTKIMRLEYDIRKTQAKIIGNGLPPFLAERLARGV